LKVKVKVREAHRVLSTPEIIQLESEPQGTRVVGAHHHRQIYSYYRTILNINLRHKIDSRPKNENRNNPKRAVEVRMVESQTALDGNRKSEARVAP
jgi:hypothetical protein